MVQMEDLLASHGGIFCFCGSSFERHSNKRHESVAELLTLTHLGHSLSK